MAIDNNYSNLLEIYGQAKGRGPSTESIIQRLRQRQQFAREQDDQKRKNISSGAKALWNTDKALKGYQLAQKGGYKGGFMEFMRNPEMAGVYEQKGFEMVGSGRESKPGGIRVVFGNIKENQNLKKLEASAEKTRSLKAVEPKGSMPIAKSNLEPISVPEGMGKGLPEGESAIHAIEKIKENAIPMMEPVEVIGTKGGSAAANTSGLKDVMGKAGPVAGKVLAGAGVAAGLKNMADKGVNRKNVAGTAVSALTLASMFNPALAPFALAASIGSYLKKARG